jgi:long-chain acyl-CoA synthetase
VGRPSAEWGEEVFAFVVLKPGSRVSSTDLDRRCLENIARFKRPKAYEFVESLPKNNYGKVLKKELRAALEKGTHEGS